MCKIWEFLGQYTRRNNLSKLPTFDLIFQLPHSAMHQVSRRLALVKNQSLVVLNISLFSTTFIIPGFFKKNPNIFSPPSCLIEVELSQRDSGIEKSFLRGQRNLFAGQQTNPSRRWLHCADFHYFLL